MRKFSYNDLTLIQHLVQEKIKKAKDAQSVNAYHPLLKLVRAKKRAENYEKNED